jgi:hypothetical protein
MTNAEKKTEIGAIGRRQVRGTKINPQRIRGGAIGLSPPILVPMLHDMSLMCRLIEVPD